MLQLANSSLEYVKAWRANNIFWERVPLHNCQREKGVLVVVLYRKFPKYSDTQNIRTPKKFVIVITLKFELWLYHRVMSPNDADRMANNVDADQPAPLEAV